MGLELAPSSIEYISTVARALKSPQAKGRVERVFGTLQDRLVKELRLAGISTVEAANAWLPGFVEMKWKEFGYNHR